jgi:hypothetical protein
MRSVATRLSRLSESFRLERIDLKGRSSKQFFDELYIVGLLGMEIRHKRDKLSGSHPISAALSAQSRQ